MYTLKTKFINPSVSTLGQLNYQKSVSPSSVYELRSFPGRDPAGLDFAPATHENDVKWTLPDKLCSKSPPRVSNPAFVKDLSIEDSKDDTPCCKLSEKTPRTEPTAPTVVTLNTGKPATVNPKTSEMGIQADIPHYKKCKTCVTKRNCYTDCDSQVDVDLNGRTTGGGDARKKWPRNLDSSRSHSLLKKPQGVNVPRGMTVWQVIRRICVLMISAVLIVSVVLFSDTKIEVMELIEAIIVDLYYYVSSTKVQDVGEKPSYTNRIFYELFGVKREHRFRRLF